MKSVTIFPSFIPSYKRLKENQHKVFHIEFYHHDPNSEPTFYINSKALDIRFEKIEDEWMSITIRTPEIELTFGERNYFTNLSNDDVVFSSKFDDETYCLISFS